MLMQQCSHWICSTHTVLISLYSTNALPFHVPLCHCSSLEYFDIYERFCDTECCKPAVSIKTAILWFQVRSVFNNLCQLHFLHEKLIIHNHYIILLCGLD
jgi:hypothetical protein